MLTRLGNKKNLIGAIHKYFPTHKMRIELFFGAGGAFFNMPKAKYNILNDLDDDVVNLYLTLQNDKEGLYRAIDKIPVASSLIKYYKASNEVDPIQKAVRFLLLSNFTYLGKGDTLRLGLDNTKRLLLESIDVVFEQIKHAQITNYDFREVIGKISFSETVLSKSDAFVYLDPVYLDTVSFYKVPNWRKEDTIDCFNLMSDCGIKCAMSEFDHPTVLHEAQRRGFKVIGISSRQNIKNRRTEVLITNYHPQNQLF